jgi:hypothetical protein
MNKLPQEKAVLIFWYKTPFYLNKNGAQIRFKNMLHTEEPTRSTTASCNITSKL